MSFIIVCTILVSLSEIFQSDKAQVTDAVLTDGQTPIYPAVLVSLLMPLICTIFSNFIKYADKVMRLDALDWNCAFYFFMTLTF